MTGIYDGKKAKLLTENITQVLHVGVALAKIKCDHNDQSFEYQYEACEETSVPIPDLVESVTEKQYFRVVFGIELILQKSGKFGCIGDCVDHLSIEISVLSPK